MRIRRSVSYAPRQINSVTSMPPELIPRTSINIGLNAIMTITILKYGTIGLVFGSSLPVTGARSGGNGLRILRSRHRSISSRYPPCRDIQRKQRMKIKISAEDIHGFPTWDTVSLKQHAHRRCHGAHYLHKRSLIPIVWIRPATYCCKFLGFLQHLGANYFVMKRK